MFYLKGKTSGNKKFGIGDTPPEFVNCMITNITKAKYPQLPTASFMFISLETTSAVDVHPVGKNKKP